MPKPKFSKLDIVREYCRRFPQSSHLALARKIRKENKGLYANLKAAETAVRRARGKQGANSRSMCHPHGLYESAARSDRDGHLLPEGKVQMPDWEILRYDAAGWWLVISDIHIPWHNRQAVEMFADEARRRKVVGILLNGDIVDCHECSDHERDPRVRVFAEEIRIVREFLSQLRRQFPKARIVWKLGNHEERYQKYMMRHAPELLDLDDFKWESICRTADSRVEVVADCQPIRLGQLATIHGHEYRFAISNPVSASRGLFLRGGVSALCGHFHRTSQFSKRDLLDHVVSVWSAGCLCDLRPRWLPINDWNHGGAFVRVGAGGEYELDNYRIIDGAMYR